MAGCPGFARGGSHGAPLRRTVRGRVCERCPPTSPSRVLVLFLPRAPGESVLANIEPPADEEFELVGRELFVHFPEGMGKSRFRVPLMDVGTGRNLNTVRSLLAMARGN